MGSETGLTAVGKHPCLDKFVVGVDASPESLYSLDLAAALGAPNRTELVIVHVCARPGSLGFEPPAAAEYRQTILEIDQIVEAEVASRLTGYQGKSSIVFREGHVGHALLDVADDVDADLIIIGHRSHGPVRDAIFGSAATKTVRHSRRSVLVAIPPRVDD